MKLTCLLTCLAPVLLACSGQTQAGEALVLTGSSTVAPLAGELAARYEAQHPGVRIDVQSGGSGRGIADTRKGTADIGMASRTLAPDEQDLTAHTIANDGIALIVHASNPLGALTTEQVRAIYLGQVDDWSALGGAPGPITVVHKAEGRATLAVFLAHMGLSNKAVEADVVAGENEHAIKTVAGTPGAVGYVSIGTAQVDIAAGVAIRVVALDGVLPSAATLKAGTYPMTRPLNLLTKGAPSARAQSFLDFALAPEQHDLILRESFLPAESWRTPHR